MQARVINAPHVAGYEDALTDAARRLAGGALLVIPTETVYGVAASPLNREAMDRLHALKRSSNGRPFTVHLGAPERARDYVSSPSPLLRRFVRRAWPGPLTILVRTDPKATPIGERFPDAIPNIYHDGTVGLRCPDHQVAGFVLDGAGAPIVASSANRSGEPPPRDAREALERLDDGVDIVIDSGPARYGMASTIIEVDGNSWRIRRPGRIDERTLKRMERTSILLVCTGNSCRSPMAEHLFRRKLAERLKKGPEELEAEGLTVASAGVAAAAGAPASPNAVEVMKRRGMDLSAHRTRPVTVEALLAAEYIYAMTPEHRAAVLELAPGAAAKVRLLDPSGPVSDPVGGTPDAYERCAAQLEEAVAKRLEEVLDEDRNW